MDEHTATQTLEPNPGAASDVAISLTDSAAEMAKATLQREGLAEHALRVAVAGGGCSGFQYALSFDNTVRPDDTVVEQNGIRLLVDSSSLPYLKGVTIDYVHGLHGAGFKFLNPNATRTCGCGSSFSA